MLPGVGFTEMLLLVVLALVVVGPRDLPLMMRKFGRMTGRVRAMAFEFRQSFDELGRLAEIDELKKEVAELKKQSGIDEFQKEIEEEKREFDKTQADFESDMVKSLNVAGGSGLDLDALAEMESGEAGEIADGDNKIGGDVAEAASEKSAADDAQADQPEDSPAENTAEAEKTKQGSEA